MPAGAPPKEPLRLWSPSPSDAWKPTPGWTCLPASWARWPRPSCHRRRCGTGCGGHGFGHALHPALTLAGGLVAIAGGSLGGHMSLVRKVGTADPAFADAATEV